MINYSIVMRIANFRSLSFPVFPVMIIPSYFHCILLFFSYLCNKFRKNELLYNKQTVKQGHK